MMTRALSARFDELAPTPRFLRGFFPDADPKPTSELMWAVTRTTETVAESVARGELGNRNEIAKGTEKWVLPPMMREYFDISQWKLYDRIFASTQVSDGYVNAFMNQVEMSMKKCLEKIERRYEVMCAQFLNDGVVVDAIYGNYDFGRVAGSKVDGGSGTYWNTDSINPFDQIADGCAWLRTEGMVDGARFLCLCGESVLKTLQNNAIYKDRTSQLSNQLNTLVRPSRAPGGATFHGTLSCGDYEVELWTYPQYYKPSTGNKRQYLEPKKISIIPERPDWITDYALVPQLIDEQNPVAMTGKYIYGNFRDPRAVSHEYDVRSCGLIIPMAVNQVYTRRVVA